MKIKDVTITFDPSNLHDMKCAFDAMASFLIKSYDDQIDQALSNVHATQIEAELGEYVTTLFKDYLVSYKAPVIHDDELDAMANIDFGTDLNAALTHLKLIGRI